MVTLQEVREAAARIEGRVIRTPLVYSPTFSERTGAEVYLKLESMQKAGSFKVRGAVNRILSQREAIGGGVIAASAGNHAQGVAVAAGIAGVRATIVMPDWVSPGKQEAAAGYGAEILLHGATLEESIARAMEIAGERGLTFIHPFDDRSVIAGQGTIGLEILEDLPGVDRIIVPVGGGGLISGIASAVKAVRPGVRITGVQADACPSAEAALAGRGPVTIDSSPTVADGIRVNRIGDLAFPAIRDMVDRVVTVSDQAIMDAVLALLERKKVLAEGAGAAPLAALLSGAIQPNPAEKLVLLISGGNIDTFLLQRILQKGLIDAGRILVISAEMEEGARSLPSFLTLVARENGLVTRITQDRSAPDLPVHLLRATIEVEVRGRAHGERILSALRREGYAAVTAPAELRTCPDRSRDPV